ncbi:hypothetical protein B0T26DRAFT_314160 [Lasiosphaeria miniovina]|uniref:Secreted protein n=1 Tax=Lasiosphaeria miniovina TaxID=1954250 RepID=A0AA40ALM4_9PEZI|nr:uncharacterized protein B0T26DRAFT_314160 [Lasiosphaeria miniovina]KAK0718126.1 hypothetical protein B0T26DRAFT_314160 [Lasiosphaeria miniovina]
MPMPTRPLWYCCCCCYLASSLLFPRPHCISTPNTQEKGKESACMCICRGLYEQVTRNPCWFLDGRAEVNIETRVKRMK